MCTSFLTPWSNITLMIRFEFSKPAVLKLTFLLAVIFASFLFLKQGGHSGISFQHADKVGHFVIFFSLALLLDLAFQFSVKKSLIILSAYGVLIEFMQSFLPYREASLGDVIADVFGVAVYLLLARKYFQTLLNKLLNEQ